MKKNGGEVRPMGRFVVCDPAVCHGKPTFRGTRVLVAEVLDQVAEGMALEAIVEQWHNRVSREAIREAVELAAEALDRHREELLLDPVPA
jgi:uncharacterized protein (DUF433 family)